MRIMIFLAVSHCLAPAISAQVRYRITPLGDLPGGYDTSFALAINDSGQVAGYSSREAIRFEPDIGLVPLGSLRRDNPGSQGIGINSLGHVVGHSASLNGAGGEAFLWTPEGGMIGLGALAPGYDRFASKAHDVNDHGQVVGFSRLPNGDTEAFLWTAETGMIGLGDLPGSYHFSYATSINNAGVVVGSGSSRRAFEVFIWEAETGMRRLGPLPIAGEYPETGTVNEAGQIAGGTTLLEAYLWDPQTGFTMLGFLPGPSPMTSAWALNDHGTVVGRASRDFSFDPDPPHPVIECFVYDARHGMRAINELIEPCADPRYLPIRDANSINNLGQIAAQPDWNLALDIGVILTPTILADTDLDGDTDLYDLAVVLAHFGETGPAVTYEIGDVDEDFDVDLMAHVLTRFGRRCRVAGHPHDPAPPP
jgi:probable HAF family extracellular repeat protein